MIIYSGHNLIGCVHIIKYSGHTLIGCVHMIIYSGHTQYYFRGSIMSGGDDGTVVFMIKRSRAKVYEADLTVLYSTMITLL